MTLTHQLFITLTLPAAFLALALYTWRQCRFRRYGQYWALTLLVGALWSSSLLTHYSGAALTRQIVFHWQTSARHVLTAFALLALLSTMEFLNAPRAHRRLLFGITAFFWILSLLIDPAVVPYNIVPWAGAARVQTQFHLWSSVWVTAWLLPFLAAFLLARDAGQKALSALYHNRLHYWAVTLALLCISGLVALIQQPGQPAWQELGGLGLLFSAALGVHSLLRRNLTPLKRAVRYAVARLAASLLTLVLAWVFLVLIIDGIADQGDRPSILELGLAATFFTALFGAVNRLVPALFRRMLLPDEHRRSATLAQDPQVTGVLPDPAALGQMLLQLTQFNIAIEGARLYLLQQQDVEQVRLQQVAAVGAVEGHETLELATSGALMQHLRQRLPSPLTTYELETLPAFADMAAAERERLRQAKVELLMPLGAGDDLVAVLALGQKFSGEAYDHVDFNWLEDVSAHGGLLLWQAKELQQAAQEVARSRRAACDLQSEMQRLRELLLLHQRLAQMISPALREPLVEIHQTVEAIEREHRAAGVAPAIHELNRHLAQLRLMLDNLIVNAGRVSHQHDFSFAPVDLGEVVNKAVHDLQTMSSARRVTVNVIPSPNLPTFQGDWLRLYDAVQHLIHNAIRFNRIGGCVDVEYGLGDGRFFLTVRDDGLGIPEERLPHIWQGRPPSAGRAADAIGPSMGLALTSFIVRAHGGDIDVESTLGLGSAFTVYLPAPTEAAAHAAP